MRTEKVKWKVEGTGQIVAKNVKTREEWNWRRKNSRSGKEVCLIVNLVIQFDSKYCLFILVELNKIKMQKKKKIAFNCITKTKQSSNILLDNQKEEKKERKRKIRAVVIESVVLCERKQKQLSKVNEERRNENVIKAKSSFGTGM